MRSPTNRYLTLANRKSHTLVQYNRFVITSEPQCYRLELWGTAHQHLELHACVGMTCAKYFPHAIKEKFGISAILLVKQSFGRSRILVDCSQKFGTLFTEMWYIGWIFL